jgi:hypothetical protein
MPYKDFGISTQNTRIDKDFEDQIDWDVAADLEGVFVGDWFWQTIDEVYLEMSQTVYKEA